MPKQPTTETTETTEHNAIWASGDFPPRAGNQVHPLIDGRAAMLAMCRAFLSAKRYILIAGWDIRADLPMVRGEDTHVGAEGSDEQRALIEGLRAEGLSDEAIDLWNSNHLTVCDVLGFAASHGVKVGVLLWDALNLGAHLTNNPAHEAKELEAVGVDVLLDDSSRKITHITQSLHQKCTVVDGRIAFVGGIDLTCQADGDYDRWDTHQHPCASIERGTDVLTLPEDKGIQMSAAEHPWHDVHTVIEGPIVADVLRNIAQRWHDTAKRHKRADWPAELSAELDKAPPAPQQNGHMAQIVRTIPHNTYAFAPDGIFTIRDAYQRALGQAQTFAYFENQYLWKEVYIGLDIRQWGERSPEMMEVFEAIGEALERGVTVALTLPDHPNCGREFTDGGVQWLRERAPEAVEAGRLFVFTLGNSDQHENAPGGVLYRPVYVHAKVGIFDDQLWTAGSANLNSRGMRSDAEINVVSLHPARARHLRQKLWAEHLDLPQEKAAELDDPLAGLALMRASAMKNKQHVERRELLEGHLLPYITHAEGQAQGLPVHKEHGWLDNLEGGAGGLPDQYAQKYL